MQNPRRYCSEGGWFYRFRWPVSPEYAPVPVSSFGLWCFRGKTVVKMQFIMLMVSYLLISGPCFAEGNASNPLAKVKNTDIRAQYHDKQDGSYYWDFWLADGAFMATDKLKIKYELHYWKTDVTGSSENAMESLHVKPIYFPKSGKLGDWNYSLAVGLEWIKDFRNTDQGIGTGGDQLAPLVGLALTRKPGWVFIPLLQHFLSYRGEDVNKTATRLIAIQSLENAKWLKYDLIVPFDWENDNAIPATAEVQFGKMYNKQFGLYADIKAGLGSDRPFDWGAGIGARFVY